MRPTTSTILVLILALLLFPLDQRLALTHEVLNFVRGAASDPCLESTDTATGLGSGLIRCVESRK